MCLNAHCHVKFRLRFLRGQRGQTLRLALAHEVEVRAEQSLSIYEPCQCSPVTIIEKAITVLKTEERSDWERKIRTER